MTKALSGWRDECPSDRALSLGHIEPVRLGWRRFRSCELRVEPIAGAAFKRGTDDFRDAYNHRFLVRFVVGISAIVSRATDAGDGVSYSIRSGSSPRQLRPSRTSGRGTRSRLPVQGARRPRSETRPGSRTSSMRSFRANLLPTAV